MYIQPKHARRGDMMNNAFPAEVVFYQYQLWVKANDIWHRYNGRHSELEDMTGYITEEEVEELNNSLPSKIMAEAFMKSLANSTKP